MKTGLLLASLGWTLVARSALADERGGEGPIVTGYDAPPECPGSEALAASVRAELSRRDPSHARPLQVQVAIAHDEQGYSARATATDDQGHALERTVQAHTCGEVADIVAALVALAQSDSNAGDTATVAEVLPAVPQEAPATAIAPAEGRWLTYSFSLGYGAFTAGPANPVFQKTFERTTFNPAQGARLGFGVSHAFGGWWRPSLEVSAAYYRQGTTTVPESNVTSPQQNPFATTDISDRDVLLATFDACPVRVEYKFLALLPCATFSMMQNRGNSGNDPQLETGLGGSLRLRGEFAGSFFVEAMGAAVGVTSSYEPPSSSARIFYAVSLGVTIR